MAYFLFSDHPESTFVESKLQFRAILLVSALIALLVSGFFQIGFPFLRVFVSFVKGICLLAQKLLFKVTNTSNSHEIIKASSFEKY